VGGGIISPRNACLFRIRHVRYTDLWARSMREKAP
jgi:hypothetical protein